MLRVTATRVQAAAVPEAADAGSRPRPVEGRRVVGALLGIFLIMVVMACGLAWCDGGSTGYHSFTTLEKEPVTPRSERSSAYVAPAPTRPARPSTDVCPESRGAFAPVRSNAATTARVNAAWQRIEKWLARNAPKSAASLGPPAPVQKLDDLQRRMSVPFPPDLVASLRRHDGVTGMRGFAFPPFYKPMSLTEIFSDWQGNCDVMADFEFWGGEDDWWHRQYVPFGMDGSGGDLIVDQRPGHHGRVGDTDPEVGADFVEWPASVAELLEQTASALETGRPFQGHAWPVVRDGLLDWDYR
ncbi:SMI1/KNR4 family protein [Actinoplanes utahensis]|uniref:SMI1/KNR4 family protein n=1 Tax=Actinoplanes utahensis TaxID=1869 RepID=UPI00068FC34D|nr:SMI1/KNR4 family protein [Actinoplanes utahensis]